MFIREIKKNMATAAQENEMARLVWDIVVNG